MQKGNTIQILIDSREQKPLLFENNKVESIDIVCLPYGDYRAKLDDGYLPSIVFERKSISDLFGTLSKGYERFKKEINKAKKDNVQLIIIIEGTLTKISKGNKYSHRSGDSIIKQLFTLMIKHNILFVCCKDRSEMANYITNFYLSYNINRKNNNFINNNK